MSELTDEIMNEASVSTKGGVNIFQDIASAIKQGKEAIQQGKEAIQMLNGMRGANLGRLGKIIDSNAAAPAEKKNVQGFMAIVQQLGVADTPIGEIIEKLKPYSLNQLKEMGAEFLADKLPPGLGDDVRTKPGK